MSRKNWSISLLASLLGLGLLLANGCGYHLSSRIPVALPKGMTRLALAQVDQPTTKGWLEPYLRRNFQDELTSRGQIQWVPRDQAQGLVYIEIQSYSDSGTHMSSDEETVVSEVRIRGQARILGTQEDQVVWRSGPVSVANSYQTENQDQTTIGKETVEDFTELLVDRLGTGF